MRPALFYRRRQWLFHPWTSRVAVVGLLLVLPLLIPSTTVSLAFVAMEYSLFAIGLTIIVGWTGLLDLGAAGFVAVGAYTAAICMTIFGLPVLAVLPIAFLVGVLTGALLGIPTLRHRADYFAILTLGFAELVSLTIRNWTPVTRGSYGISGIPAATLPFLTDPLRASPPIGFYYLAAAIVIPGYCAIVWLRSSRLGREFHVIKHSETVAKCYGINVLTVKLVAFGLSAGFLGIGGAFWAAYQRSIIWTEFDVLLSCMLLSLLIVGGLGSPRGAIIGAALVGTALEVLRRVLTVSNIPPNTRFFFFALALVTFIHLRPRGIIVDRPSWSPRRNDPSAHVRGSVKRPSRSGTKKVCTNEFLEITQVSKRFGGVVALDQASLRGADGQCTALIGPNGSGKTTLLNLISGLLRPDGGSISFLGNRIDRLPPYQIARAGIGRSFQEISVFDDISTKDNVLVTAGDASRKEIRTALDRFCLPRRAVACADLSYGDKKKLDLARLFVGSHTYRLVLLDEPTAGLTQHEAQDVVAALAELRQKTAMAMIIVSHDVMFLDALNVDRVVVLNRGSVFKEGCFHTIRHDPEVLSLFWGNESEVS